ncbi:MAG: hypothetical protein AAB434_04735 [Planctomycetota bacterium]
MTDGLDRVRAVLAAPDPAAPGPAHRDASLGETVWYLESDAARESLEADPYWPKWESPWWRMTLLWEMGLADRIPPATARALVHALSTKCLHTFPFRIEDVPAGVDPIRGIPCHCQLGTGYQVLAACGVDVDCELPWIRAWFLKYQLPDGGLNCDEEAYVRPTPRSSVVSTLPPMEAVLRCTPRNFTAEEEAFLDRGAAYLITRSLCRSVKRGGAIIDATWLETGFPRFYFYDVLRGLSFLVEWAEKRRLALPAASVLETCERLAGGELRPVREDVAKTRTRRRTPEGEWERGVPAGTFPLLGEVSDPARPSPALGASWRKAKEGLRRLDADSLLT